MLLLTGMILTSQTAVDSCIHSLSHVLDGKWHEPHPQWLNNTVLWSTIWEPEPTTGWTRTLSGMFVRLATRCSLIPWPLPPPVFDCLQYAYTEEEGLGDLVTWHKVDWSQTHGGVSNSSNHYLSNLAALLMVTVYTAILNSPFSSDSRTSNW